MLSTPAVAPMNKKKPKKRPTVFPYSRKGNKTWSTKTFAS